MKFKKYGNASKILQKRLKKKKNLKNMEFKKYRNASKILRKRLKNIGKSPKNIGKYTLKNICQLQSEHALNF